MASTKSYKIWQNSFHHAQLEKICHFDLTDCKGIFAHVSYSAFDAGCLSFVQIVLLLQGLRHHFVAPQHLLLHIFELPDQVKLIGSLRLAVVFIAKEGKHLCEKR